jgi:tripeptide aminopeptidase
MSYVANIAQHNQVQAVLQAFEKDVPAILELAIAIQQIPAPTFAESRRAAFVETYLRGLGLSDVHQDEYHNVFARYSGSTGESAVVLSAHLDTVFPEETELSVQRQNGRGLIYGPGLADNAVGVAGMLALGRVLTRFSLRLPADVWLVANVAEEGLGNLLGMRTTVDRFGSRASYIIIEGGCFGHVFNQAIAVRRYRISAVTGGGHSWGDFGSPSAIHALGHVIAAIDKLQVPAEPKTSYNVGTITGGTSVNTIAASASLELDLRSAGTETLDKLVDQVRQIVNRANRQSGVHVTMNQIGDRPAGQLKEDLPLVRWAAEALKVVGCQQIIFQAGSTDANIPISRGLPAVCIGLANSGNTHRLDEFLDPANLPAGLKQLLLLTLAAAGFETGGPDAGEIRKEKQ